MAPDRTDRGQEIAKECRYPTCMLTQPCRRRLAVVPLGGTTHANGPLNGKLLSGSATSTHDTMEKAYVEKFWPLPLPVSSLAPRFPFSRARRKPRAAALRPPKRSTRATTRRALPIARSARRIGRLTRRPMRATTGSRRPPSSLFSAWLLRDPREPPAGPFFVSAVSEGIKSRRTTRSRDLPRSRRGRRGWCGFPPLPRCASHIWPSCSRAGARRGA